MTTKRLVYLHPEEGVTVIAPMQHARLAAGVRYRGETITFDGPAPLSVVEKLAKGINGAAPSPDEILYAETEASFLRRTLARVVETAAQRTSRGKIVNPHLTSETPVYVVEASDVPAVRADRAAWFAEVSRSAPRIQVAP